MFLFFHLVCVQRVTCLPSDSATGALLAGSGYPVVVYLDDGLGAAADAEAATRDSLIECTCSTLERASFLVHPVKSV